MGTKELIGGAFLILFVGIAGGFFTGQYVGQLQATNIIYKVELEKAQKLTSIGLGITEAYKGGKK